MPWEAMTRRACDLETVEALLRRHPDRTDRFISALCNVDHNTVRRHRRRMIAAGMIAAFDIHESKYGRRYRNPRGNGSPPRRRRRRAV
jgi:hypothetical protein